MFVPVRTEDWCIQGELLSVESACVLSGVSEFVVGLLHSIAKKQSRDLIFSVRFTVSLNYNVRLHPCRKIVLLLNDISQ